MVDEASLEMMHEEEPEGLQMCRACLGSTQKSYQVYNLVVSGVVLAVFGMIGLCGNTLVVRVYLSRTQRIHSTSIYLASLAMSDFMLIVTAMFLFVLEAWRHHNHDFIAWLYVSGAPLVFPLASVFQTSSVYFCVAAAVDCFITVVLPASVKEIYCTPARARKTVMWIMILCVLYNIPHVFELEKVDCIDDYGNNSTQICPTSFRSNPVYYDIYYTYMYTTFLAIGPLLLLILLNVCVVYTVVRSTETAEESDTVSLILVVFFFIFCNFMALLVNFLELYFHEKLGEMLVYFVDLSNLLIVINATANFFCYLIFGASFRRTLCEVLHPRRTQLKAVYLNGQIKIPENRNLI